MRFNISLLFLGGLSTLSLVASTSGDDSYKERNLNTIKAIYDRNVYPTNLDFIQNGASSVPPGLFSANASGRISPVGNFTSFEDTVEYFFALAPVPVAPLYTAFTAGDIIEFTSGCPEVASSVVYFTEKVVNPGAPNDGQYITSLKQVAFWRFDSNGSVVNYDAWIPNLSAYENAILGLGIYDELPPPVQNESISSLCQLIEQRCTGNDTQYADATDCQNQLSAKRFGTGDETWGDNVVCRQVHVILTQIRPDIHCPHVGPTGGMKCVDVAYNDVYFDDETLLGAPRGTTFTCPEEAALLAQGASSSLERGS